MIKSIKIITISFIFLMMCLIIFLQQQWGKQDDQFFKEQRAKIISLEKENSELAIELRKWSVVDSLLLAAAPENYDRRFNNCYQQSQRLQQTLAKEDIESSIFVNKDRSHAWLAVWIDAVDGKFVKPGQYNLMEVRDINLDVICSNEIRNRAKD